MKYKYYNSGSESKIFLKKLSTLNYPYPVTYRTTTDGKPMLLYQIHTRGTYTKKFVIDMNCRKFRVSCKPNFIEIGCAIFSVFLLLISMFAFFSLIFADIELKTSALITGLTCLIAPQYLFY